jgi:hypothetical protein
MLRETRLCRKCQNPIEGARPNQARYCKRCALRRSIDWKHEHPDRVGLYEEQVKQWRVRHDWSRYIRVWREEHYQRYREQNRRHVQTYREWQRRLQAAPPPRADPVGDQPSHKTASSSGSVRIALLVCISVVGLLVAGFVLGRGALPSPRDISFEAIRRIIVDLKVLAVEVAGLVAILAWCWSYATEHWRRK